LYFSAFLFLRLPHTPISDVNYHLGMDPTGCIREETFGPFAVGGPFSLRMWALLGCLFRLSSLLRLFCVFLG